MLLVRRHRHPVPHVAGVSTRALDCKAVKVPTTGGMDVDWLAGEPDGDGGVQLYARCGRCGAKLPVRDGDEAREALEWHALARHDDVSWGLMGSAGAA
jgi:hypothetical protein